MLLPLALNALGLPHNIKHGSALLASQAFTCPAGCAPAATLHGDPMFKVRNHSSPHPPHPPTPPEACLCADTLPKTVAFTATRSMAPARTSGSARAS